MAATDDLPPRFFKVFISHLSSDSMMIPLSYYDELPSPLPKTVILHGTGGCVWKVAMKEKQDEVHFEKGWTKFVKDNSLVDGDFLTFVYDGDCVFEVSIYGLDTYKETRVVATEREDEKEDGVIYLSSEEDTEKADKVPRSMDKGKSKVEVEEDSDDDVYHLSDEEDTDTDSDFEMADVVSKTKKKGKKKVEDSESYDDDDDSDDSDYIEAFGNLDVSDDSNSDSSYAPDIEPTTAIVKAKAKNPEERDVFPVKGKRMSKVRPKIKNPEAYLDDPSNIHFETSVKNRKYELLVHAQLVKDYCLKFEDYIDYIDKYGKLSAKTARWKDERVCIKRWIRICARNKLERNDRILCELLRNQNVVYAIKIHIVRARFLETLS